MLHVCGSFYKSFFCFWFCCRLHQQLTERVNMDSNLSFRCARSRALSLRLTTLPFIINSFLLVLVLSVFFFFFFRSDWCHVNTYLYDILDLLEMRGYTMNRGARYCIVPWLYSVRRVYVGPMQCSISSRHCIVFFIYLFGLVSSSTCRSPIWMPWHGAPVGLVMAFRIT